MKTPGKIKILPKSTIVLYFLDHWLRKYNMKKVPMNIGALYISMTLLPMMDNQNNTILKEVYFFHVFISSSGLAL